MFQSSCLYVRYIEFNAKTTKICKWSNMNRLTFSCFILIIKCNRMISTNTPNPPKNQVWIILDSRSSIGWAHILNTHPASISAILKSNKDEVGPFLILQGICSKLWQFQEDNIVILLLIRRIIIRICLIFPAWRLWEDTAGKTSIAQN